jgi:hypothetical protein
MGKCKKDGCKRERLLVDGEWVKMCTRDADLLRANAAAMKEIERLTSHAAADEARREHRRNTALIILGLPLISVVPAIVYLGFDNAVLSLVIAAAGFGLCLFGSGAFKDTRR